MSLQSSGRTFYSGGAIRRLTVCELSAAEAPKPRRPNAGREWAWQWVFPATRVYRDRLTGQLRRHHLHESVLQRAVKDAVRHAGIAKRARHPHRARAARPS